MSYSVNLYVGSFGVYDLQKLNHCAQAQPNTLQCSTTTTQCTTELLSDTYGHLLSFAAFVNCW